MTNPRIFVSILVALWRDKQSPPQGHHSRTLSKVALEAKLTDARGAAIDHIRIGVTFATAADDWLEDGERKRG